MREISQGNALCPNWAVMMNTFLYPSFSSSSSQTFLNFTVNTINGHHNRSRFCLFYQNSL